MITRLIFPLLLFLISACSEDESPNPPSLSYSQNVQSGIVGYNLSIEPTSLNPGDSSVTKCNIFEGTLPPGFSIDSSTCVISGFSESTLSETQFTVVAELASGSEISGDFFLELINPSISYSPADNASVFWIDQSRPNNNVPPQTQRWGQVFRTPSSGGSILSWISFFGSSNDSTFLQIRIREWDSETNTPSPAVLFESEPVSFPFSIIHSSAFGRPAHVFNTSLQLNPNQFYIVELLGDGVAGLATLSGAFTQEGIHLSQNGAAWNQFGGISFRADLVFE